MPFAETVKDIQQYTFGQIIVSINLILCMKYTHRET